MKVFLGVLKPALPLLCIFLILAIAYGAFRLYQVKSLREQAGTKRVEGVAGNSLATERMHIRKDARVKGLVGEEGVGALLEELADQFGLIVLHDLSMPDTKANIDHVLIQKKAVFVIDAKNYEGKVNIKKDSKGVMQLYVGGTKRTLLATKLKSYSQRIEKYLREEGITVKVVPLLAFYKASFHPDSRYEIDGVMVNVSGIKNELMRFAVRNGAEINQDLVANLILKEFPLKN
jgi:cellobiose-specific phosphotransferase system component IIB